MAALSRKKAKLLIGPSLASGISSTPPMLENRSKTERNRSAMSAFQGLTAPKNSTSPFGDIVEIGLLLPAARVDELVQLSRRRSQTVAQLLRSLIDDALSGDAPRETPVSPIRN
jgi:hypothetical protein